ncbi:uncharacterized protein LOC18427615 isoform X1 [Amborella trichopoda]|uniref:RanBP2-type domain-containing protein n=1 Tax=Amborella trichopoda TaxID=13333 RepID=W1NWC5_AMBTC|nr:uncharacterized protein LOC18427615 isoform X1 [Amborella trichopoda]ERM99580.1 hypothetical protein AMTR_s00088p00130080 [Amborella trichopoda]|eukprot:XP_006836727.1 uncharacterized protein LOC18427615 isoform X1 [Amborella trichopoda]
MNLTNSMLFSIKSNLRSASLKALCNLRYIFLRSYRDACPQRKQVGSNLGLVLNEVADIQAIKRSGQEEEEDEDDLEEVKGLIGDFPFEANRVAEISRLWPEWLELMDLLYEKGYIMGNSGSNKNEFGDSKNVFGDSNRVRTACLNLARDRYDIMRYLSRKDIYAIAACGCPSLDRKVVNSGKRLRAYVGIDEGDACSSCSLRGSCERAYVKARENEGGRTVDVMRILLTYGLEPITGSVENKPCLNNTVRASVRRLLKEMVVSSAKEPEPDASESKHSDHQRVPKAQVNALLKQGDWICPKCNFMNFAKNVKCLRCDVVPERHVNLREDGEPVGMKKGDWFCAKCNFMNFARNTKCFQCGEKPPKRQLNPGEWECPSCNYINFRRNMVCLKCDWKRPKTLNCGENSLSPQNKFPEFRQGSKKTWFGNNCKTNNYRSVEEDNNGESTEVNFWDSGDEEREMAHTSRRGRLEFEDFPVKGGKSTISQERERDNRERENRWGRLSSHERFDVSYNGCSNSDDDDDEMAGWFGK